MSALHSLHSLSGWNSQGQGGGDTEMYCQPPSDNVEGTLLTELQVREE